MSLQNSPGFDQEEVDRFEEGSNKKEDRERRRGGFWIIVSILVVVLLVLAAINLVDNKTFDALRGKGAVSGIVVDEDGNGVLAEVMIAGTNLSTRTDETGYFLMSDIPEGQRTLVVGFDQTGWQYPVVIIAGQTLDAGEISVITTVTP